MKIKKNDSVKVITGKDKGKEGKVLKTFPLTNKVIVEGINVRKRHQRARRAGKAGEVIEVAMPIDASNVKATEAKAKKTKKSKAKAE
jgi:large subunit ribosomal protein L24